MQDSARRLHANPAWQAVDYEPIVAASPWTWADGTSSGFRRIVDARLAPTLEHHGVTRFATANTTDVAEFGVERVRDPSSWNASSTRRAAKGPARLSG